MRLAVHGPLVRGCDTLALLAAGVCLIVSPSEYVSCTLVALAMRGCVARERIELVLDQDSPFLEICPLVGYEQDENTIGGSMVAGIGLVR
jgi:hypothetical protein